MPSMSRDRCCERRFLAWVGRLEQVPDAAGEVAFEAAHRFQAGLAFGALASDVVLGLGVASRPGERDPVDGGVDLAVAAAVEAGAGGLFPADRGRGGARGARGACLWWEELGP